jgi:hypothetical protein
VNVACSQRSSCSVNVLAFSCGRSPSAATTSWTAAKLSCGAVRDERSTRERGTRPEVEARRGRAGTAVARAEPGEAAALALGGPTDAQTPGVTNQDASNHPEVFPANGRGVAGASALEFGGLGAARTPGLPSHDASNPHAVFPASKRWGACARTWMARGRGSRAEVSPAQGADLRLRRRTSGNYLGRARSPPQRSGSVQRIGVQLRAKPVSLQRLVGPPTLSRRTRKLGGSSLRGRGGGAAAPFEPPRRLSTRGAPLRAKPSGRCARAPCASTRAVLIRHEVFGDRGTQRREPTARWNGRKPREISPNPEPSTILRR